MSKRRSARSQQKSAKGKPAAPAAATRAAAAPYEPRPWRPPWTAVLGLIAAALALRLVTVWLLYRGNPLFAYTMPGYDQNVYQDWAKEILAGDWLVRKGGLFYYAPIYAYFAGIVYKICGGQNFWALHLIQALIGALTCGLLFRLAGTWLGRVGAWTAGIVWAGLAPWLFYEQGLLHEGLLIMLYAVTLWSARRIELGARAPWALAFLAGSCIFLGTLARGNALALAPVLAVWLLFARPEGLRRPESWARAGWPAAVALCAGVALMMFLFLLRNRAVTGAWEMGMKNGTVLFYLGNAADAVGYFTETPRFQEVHALAGADMSIYWREWFVDLRNAPGHILLNLFRKAYFFFASPDLADNLSYPLARRLYPTIGLNPLQWVWLVPLGFVGAAVSLRWWRRWSLLLIFAGVFSATLIMILPTGRYRIPLFIPVAIWVGLTAEWSLHQWRTRRYGPLLAAGGAFAALVILLGPWWRPEAAKPRLNDYVNLTGAALDQGHADQARRLLREFERDYPALAHRLPQLSRARFRLARLEGNQAEAVRLADQLWGAAQQAGPGFLTPQIAQEMAEVYIAAGRRERASLIARSLYAGEETRALGQSLLEELGESPGRAAAP
ncbi:MAG TPA: glycosyltransferase family 39 protein [Candidatus Sumerlaeota bacterium]|nr:glycosyltransferase family 39 protein [Candidatus Sumerlaeota bacterium]